jgi:hypothetical protein
MAGRKELVTKVLDGDTFLAARCKNSVQLVNIEENYRGTDGMLHGGWMDVGAS